jgi:hypothetical protein
LENAIALLVIGLLANKIIELIKYLRVKDWNAAITLLGLMITATGSTVYDFKKAFDNSDSAKQPSLTNVTPTPVE